ncbi:MAG: pilin [Candidatus Paceibacterota bacterium]
MKIKNVLFVAISVIFSLYLFSQNVPASQAATCRTSCNDVAWWDAAGILNCGGNSGCFYSDASHADPGPSDDGACSIAGTGLRLCNPITIYNASCNDANMKCKESNCGGLVGANGANCVVTMGKSQQVPIFICLASSTKNGKWDLSQGKCIECSGKKESTVCADGSSIKLSNVTGNCNASDNSFDTACDAGVASVCDDKIEGAACNPPVGGTCDANGQCVAPICDNDGVKEATEACDGGDLAGETCITQGFPGGGVLACTGTCTFDTSGCSACLLAPLDGICPPGCTIATDGDCGEWNCSSGDTIDCNTFASGGTCSSFDGDPCGGPNVWNCSGNCDDPTYDNTFASCTTVTDSPQLSCGCTCGPAAVCGPADGSCPGGCTNPPDPDCPGCVPSGPENCATPGDEDCANGADCADPSCPNGTSCGGSNFCNGGSCVECVINSDCSSGEVCNAGTCIPCTEDGAPSASASLCCAGLNWVGGICTSACDPKTGFYCNPLRGTVSDVVQGGQKLIGYVLGLIGSIALLFIVIAGMMYMTSAGNEERIASSKKMLTGAIIGVAIALLAYGFLQVILKILNM